MDQPTMAYYQPEHKTSPAEYGWIYQGCNVQSRVQFWVSPDGSTKMDYYPTTGTVKTSMEHPHAGKTQMFRRNLDEQDFQRVLADSRAHIGQGCKTKADWKRYNQWKHMCTSGVYPRLG